MSEIKRRFFTIFACFFLNSFPLFAADDDVENKKMFSDTNGDIRKIAEDDKGIFTLAIENDAFSGDDYGYTNGLRVAYTSSEEQMPKFIRQASNYLPLLDKKGKKHINVALGQSMYTPSNIKTTKFIPNDFIYAGWLYTSIGIVSDTGKAYDNVVLTLGVVGPSSGAEATQKFVHHNKPGSAQPKGWDNQLKDEPGVELSYERKWREILESHPFGWGFDFMPHIGANLGNVNTSAAVGATFRFGYDLPSDYGPPRIRPTLPGSDYFIPSKKMSSYLFSVVEARAVARNIFLDGNTFKDSPSLEKKTMVKTLQLGMAVTYDDIRLFLHSHFCDQRI